VPSPPPIQAGASNDQVQDVQQKIPCMLGGPNNIWGGNLLVDCWERVPLHVLGYDKMQWGNFPAFMEEVQQLWWDEENV
jgi:hypothetical protein